MPNQRADRIVRHHPARVPDHMGIALTDPQQPVRV